MGSSFLSKCNRLFPAFHFSVSKHMIHLIQYKTFTLIHSTKKRDFQYHQLKYELAFAGGKNNLDTFENKYPFGCEQYLNREEDPRRLPK